MKNSKQFYRPALLALVAVISAGCVTRAPTPPHFIEGSKTDGIVKVGYYVNEAVQPQWERSPEVASQLCRRWGYTGAEVASVTPIADVVTGEWGIPKSGKYFVTAQCTGETK